MKSDKRAVPRTAVDLPATLQELGTRAKGNGPPTGVRIVDASPAGMRLEIGQAIPAGRAVRIDLGDAMFLGETCYCVPAENPARGYYLGIVVEQCLTDLTGLRHLIQALTPQAAPERERV